MCCPMVCYAHKRDLYPQKLYFFLSDELRKTLEVSLCHILRVCYHPILPAIQHWHASSENYLKLLTIIGAGLPSARIWIFTRTLTLLMLGMLLWGTNSCWNKKHLVKCKKHYNTSKRCTRRSHPHISTQSGKHIQELRPRMFPDPGNRIQKKISHVSKK